MQKEIDVHAFRGMQKDIDPLSHKPDYLIDAKNIRFLTRGENTSLVITNEIGTKKATYLISDGQVKEDKGCKGTYLGHCVISNYLVVFTRQEDWVSDFTDEEGNPIITPKDRIYRAELNVKDDSYTLVPYITYNDDGTIKDRDGFKLLYEGNEYEGTDLGFDVNHPIETLGYYENENIQKVYWVDGKNQPRVINVVADKLYDTTIKDLKQYFTKDSFNFVNELQLKEDIKVTKELTSSGLFPAGCVQYAITYYNKYGQESNIAYLTPIYYTSFNDRAGSPEETIGNAFKLLIKNVDTNFEYLRLYSIFRTSENGTPEVKLVKDVHLKGIGYDPSQFTSFSGVTDITLPSNPLKYDLNSEWTYLFRRLSDMLTEAVRITTDGAIYYYKAISYTNYPNAQVKIVDEDGIDRIIKWNKIDGADYTDCYLGIKCGKDNEYTTPNDVVILKKEGSGADTVWSIYNDERLLCYTFSEDAYDGTSVTIVDDNTGSSLVDPTLLLYVGGEDIIAETLADKDGTLFLGNITINRDSPKNTDITYTSKSTGEPITLPLKDYLLQGVQVNNGQRSLHFNEVNTDEGEVTVVDARDTSSENIEITITPDTEWSTEQRENDCSFTAPDNKIIIGRQHNEDENGKTKVLYATIKAEDRAGNTLDIKLKNRVKDVVWQDKKNPNIVAKAMSDGATLSILEKNMTACKTVYPAYLHYYKDRVVTGYKHHGDENAKAIVTSYEVWVDGCKITTNSDTLYTVVTLRKDKEFSTEKLDGDNYVINSMFFSGDENGLVHYVCSQFQNGKYTKSSTPKMDSKRFNTLNCIDESGYLQSPKTFKGKEIYRLGMQFQYKNGKWSEPFYIKDAVVANYPSIVSNIELVPTFTANCSLSSLLDKGYRKVRPLIVKPTLLNSSILAQGFICPTVYNVEDRESGLCYAQSSWFTRVVPKGITDGDGSNDPGENNRTEGSYPVYRHDTNLPAWHMTNAEYTGSGSKFKVDTQIQTFHSPDFIFNSDLSLIDYTDCKFRVIGAININSNFGDIDIRTSTPSISSNGQGFIHKSTYDPNGGKSLMSGLFYNDNLVKYNDANGGYYESSDNAAVYFQVYPWQMSGSLNNDVVRPANGGTRSAVLDRKIISNTKVSNSINIFDSAIDLDILTEGIKLFTSDVLQSESVAGNSYYGNVDTILTLDSDTVNKPFGVNADDTTKVISDSSEDANYLAIYNNKDSNTTFSGRKINSSDDSVNLTASDNTFPKLGKDSLLNIKEGIRIKYKSTPHAVINFTSNFPSAYDNSDYDYIYLGEIYRDNGEIYPVPTDFNLQNHEWIIAGDAVDINEITTETIIEEDGSEGTIQVDSTTVEWKYGDSYLQRFECLKTYPYTQEDENSIVDVVSFMCETRNNIDGRYDKNRHLISNIYSTPQNFNLHNPVYNQQDTYFIYRLLDDDYYNLNKFNNTLLWSLKKSNADEIDAWTNVTLANQLDLNGDNGPINKLIRHGQYMYAFQDTGISVVNFNSRVEIPTQDGVPIEISNNYKVDGYTSVSDIIGCDNKWALCKTEAGIYFIDSQSKDLYNLGSGGLSAIGYTNSMYSWLKNNTINHIWYDNVFKDLYLQSENTSLVFSEALGAFSSFVDYHQANALFNVKDKFLSFYTSGNIWLYDMFKNSNLIYGNPFDYSIAFISNNEPTVDKIFSDIQIRADWFKSDGTLITDKFFDTIQLTNEYQDTGVVSLENIKHKTSNLKKKFRIWGITVPRDSIHKRDRIRNLWTKIELTKNGKASDNSTMRFHNINMNYFK